MNTTQRGIITLLKSAIISQPCPIPIGFDLNAAQEYIRKHHILTLVYDGAVRCGISRQNPIMKSMFLEYCKVLQKSEGQMMELGRIFDSFEANDIDYMPLKGSNMKSLYPAPELRVMGDADILIHMDQYEKIIPLMRSLGFQKKAETDHELVWHSDKLLLELHKRIVPSYDRDLYACFGNGWKLAVNSNGRKYSMKPEEEFIYLFTHFTKHFRGGGIGCRHVLDLWVFRRAYPNMDECYIRTTLGKLDLLEFYDNVNNLIAVWFEEKQLDEKTDFITEYIFASGSWGSMESKVLSQTIQSARKSGVLQNGRLIYLLKNIFPSLEMLQGKYTVLKKHPCLLPIIWAVRPFYKLLWERQVFKRIASDLDVLSEKKLMEHRSLLQYVGLSPSKYQK